ncbi:hypothetical protein E2C01_044189 [Portunus trituberculatus]|uniref:Uncharacterized protein n=1 Tax=Portunus trituberculatus TaxID=210409 RepID=A0A5B7FSH0_PORTR|nr:hypothetical protein [Portunus trituberculatus]
MLSGDMLLLAPSRCPRPRPRRPDTPPAARHAPRRPEEAQKQGILCTTHPTSHSASPLLLAWSVHQTCMAVHSCSPPRKILHCSVTVAAPGDSHGTLLPPGVAVVFAG